MLFILQMFGNWQTYELSFRKVSIKLDNNKIYNI